MGLKISTVSSVFNRKKMKLSHADLKKLTAITNFTQDEIIKWHEKFRSESRNGEFDKKTFIKFFTQLNPEFKDADQFAANVFECKFSLLKALAFSTGD